MAMNPSRLGDTPVGSTSLPDGGTNELFLKVFSGEVLTTFEENNLMMPLHRVRSISSGKSAQFPVTGVAAARYHTPGESVYTDQDTPGSGSDRDYLSSINHAERVIHIDDLLISGAFIPSLDEAKNHYDVRSIYSTEIGRQLAYTADKNLMRVVIAGARKTTDRFGTAEGTSTQYLGDQIDIGDGGADAGDELVEGLFTAAQKMDEKNVPSVDRFCMVGPELYYKLISQNKDAINRDYGNEGNGSVANPGEMISVAGIRVMKTNHLPTTDESGTQDVLAGAPGVMNDTAGAAFPSTAGSGYSGQDYLGAAGTVKAIVFQSEGIGTVKLLDLAMESEYSVERQGNLLLAKYAMGHGVLREECCYNLIY